VKGISLKQPWANLIASGEKTIETRTWSTNYRGPLLIVSTKSPPIAPAGFALALADLVDCRPMEGKDEAAARCKRYDGAYAFVLANVRPIVPLPVRGARRIFDVDIAESDITFRR
jgi:hypothetical protein